MKRAAQGWGMFFGTMDADHAGGPEDWHLPLASSSRNSCAVWPRSLRPAGCCSPSRAMMGCPVGSKALASVSPKYRTPVNAIWTATVLCILYVLLAMSIKVAGTSIYVIVVNSTLVFLFLSFTMPLVAATVRLWHRQMAEPRPLGACRLASTSWSRVLSVVGMAVILFIAIAPPNERVLYVVSASSRWR